MGKVTYVDFGRSTIIDGDWYGSLIRKEGPFYLTDETSWEMFPGAAELARKSIEREEIEQRDFMEWLKGEPEEESGCE